MADTYADVRALPLDAVLRWLGVDEDWQLAADGVNMKGHCPFHCNRTNKQIFQYRTDDGRFNCFGCRVHGKGAIDLVMAYRKVGFQEAVDALKTLDVSREVAKLARKPEIKLLQVVPTENPVFKGGYDKYYVPSDWLKERGFSRQTLEAYGVGQYDNPARRSVYKGKILLPVRRWKDGELVAYLARTPEPKDDEPKYVWPKGFHKHLELFGAFRLKEKAPLRVLYLVESPLCVMKFHQLGLPAVSPFGWSVSDEQVKIISELARGVVYLPDRNKYEEISESVRKLANLVWVKTPPLPDGIEDPEQMTTDQIRSLA